MCRSTAVVPLLSLVLLGTPTNAGAAAAARQADGDGPAVLPAADADFVKKVNAAVDRADAWLAKGQQEDGGYGVYHFHSNRDYVAGQTALALLARIAAGENQYSDSLTRGFIWLKNHPPKLTYEVGLTLMVFDARSAPVGERQRVDKMTPAELAKYAFPRALQPGDADYLQPLVERLVRERFHECWSYGNDTTGQVATTADMSNTQYAVLGLKAASRMGLEFDRGVLADVLEYFLDHQQPSGKEVKWIDVRDGQDGKPKEYARKVEAKGFCYTYGTRDGPELCGSRACIGIACIELALDDLLTKGKGAALAVARKRRRDAVVSIDSALAWMQERFSVTQNPLDPLPPAGRAPPPAGGPGAPPPPPAGPGAGYFYYYLYALERVGALTARKYIGRHDWYREGADELIARQLPDGSWPSGGYDNELVNTCFALLFLRRATLRGSVTVSGDH